MIQNAIASADAFRRGVQRKTKVEPTAEEYNIFVSSAWRLCQSRPREWLRQENEYLRRIDGARKAAAADRVQKTSALGSKQRLAPASRSPHGSQSSVFKPRIHSRRPRTPRPSSNAIDGFASPDGRFPTPTSQTSGSAPTRARAVAPREDTDFESIPDMSPPIETLDHLKPLKADWKGTALDLTNDPHLHLLHPSEVGLASTLRLSCASYLTSKRRIFQDKVERAKQHKEFRKTDAQKACRIDVNKASKLWAAYEKVGWLDPKHIMKYIH
ncbi:Homeodomain-like protein [Tuber indicum]|nr:Homeodomain-like protein [Tuber indicum]